MIAAEIVRTLKSLGSPEKAKILSGFFKCGKGEYGEGDRFLGVTVPEQRAIAKANRDLPFPEIETLLGNPYHEARLTGLLVLTYAFERADEGRRKAIFDFYCAHLPAVNNWDLVDVTAPNIVGGYLTEKKLARRKVLRRFAKSKNLWERRIAIVSTFTFIRRGDFDDTLAIAELLLSDPHDLIHKATGWMLREVGKRDETVLKRFLDAHAAAMPRTMLRYAIERFSPMERARFLEKGRIKV
ncbi:MAG: DNA alkylation repair protein [Candidatus Moranbacteria bacterium]|nr:DNA alkylation repair protein [Candidatus Moranbacteria bacterium]